MSNSRKRAAKLADGVGAALKTAAQTGIPTPSVTRTFLSLATGRPVTEAWAKRNPSKVVEKVLQDSATAPAPKTSPTTKKRSATARKSVAKSSKKTSRKAAKKTVKKAAQKTSKRAKQVHISAVTGQFVSQAVAEANPTTTVSRTLKTRTDRKK